MQTQLQISCPLTNCRAKNGKSFYTPNLFCPLVIIRTKLEHNIMIAIWPFAVVCYWNRKCSRCAECALWSAQSCPSRAKSLWMVDCNNKETELTWKTKNSFNCGHITTSDCVRNREQRWVKQKISENSLFFSAHYISRWFNKHSANISLINI